MSRFLFGCSLNNPLTYWRRVSALGPWVKCTRNGARNSASSGRGVLKTYEQDIDSALYRRGLYTFIKLTQPPPSMVLFDASNRDQCEVKRSRTNTPLQALIMILNGCYTVWFVYKYSATPGTMVCGLRVVNADGSKMSLGKNIGRYGAELVSGLACDLGYVIVAFDAQKRGLHDHMCNTRVIYKPQP